MPRKCIVYDCRSGYKANKDELDAGLGDYVKKTVFGIPNFSDLASKWKQFANRAQAEASTSLGCNGGLYRPLRG